MTDQPTVRDLVLDRARNGKQVILVQYTAREADELWLRLADAEGIEVHQRSHHRLRFTGGGEILIVRYQDEKLKGYTPDAFVGNLPYGQSDIWEAQGAERL